MSYIFSWQDPLLFWVQVTQLLLVLLGAVTSLQDDWAKKHKAWVLAGFVILGIVGFWLTLAQSSQSAAETASTNTKLTNALNNLGDSNKEITRMTALNNELQEKLLASSQTIADLSRQNIAAVTGGDSFPFVIPNGGYTMMLLTTRGDNALHDVHGQIEGYNDKVEKFFNFPVFSPHMSQGICPYDFSKLDRYDFGIVQTAENGSWIETLQLRKVNGVWALALKVEKSPTKVVLHHPIQFKKVYERVDPNYPKSPDGQVEWRQWMITKTPS